jgi:hypothetical protein
MKELGTGIDHSGSVILELTNFEARQLYTLLDLLDRGRRTKETMYEASRPDFDNAFKRLADLNERLAQGPVAFTFVPIILKEDD